MWRFLADTAGEALRITIDDVDGALHEAGDDWPEIGGDEIVDVPFDDDLAGWETDLAHAAADTSGIDAALACPTHELVLLLGHALRRGSGLLIGFHLDDEGVASHSPRSQRSRTLWKFLAETARAPGPDGTAPSQAVPSSPDRVSCRLRSTPPRV